MLEFFNRYSLTINSFVSQWWQTFIFMQKWNQFKPYSDFSVASSKENTRKSSLQWFWKNERLLIYYCQKNPICSVYSGGRASFMATVHFPQLKFVFSSLLNHPSFDPSFACCEGTLRNAVLVFKSCFHYGTNKVFPKLFPPESVQFSVRKLSSVK